ncbi:MAG: VCBS repeat-containing protein, partial [Burkholderiales bacterium]|nr:VCBS repeat-containing protein [Burkholderiales bacterium]
MTISSVNQNPVLPNLGTQGTTAQGLPAQPSALTNTGGAAPTSATPAVVFGQELDSAAVRTYNAQGQLAGDNVSDAVTATNSLFATGPTDFLQVYEDTNGNAVARHWQQTANGNVAGPATVLCAWSAHLHFLVGDVNGDGKDELVVVAPDASGNANARVWTTAADGSMTNSGSTTLGPWADDTRYALGNGAGNGKAGLWVISNQGGTATNVAYLASTGTGFGMGSPTSLAGWQPNQTLFVVDATGTGKQSLVMLRPGASGMQQAIFTVQADGSMAQTVSSAGGQSQVIEAMPTVSTAGKPTGWLEVYQADAMHLGVATAQLDASGNVTWSAAQTIASQPQSRVLAGDVNGQGNTDLVQVWENAAGQAVATTWTATPTGYAKGADSILGAWQANATYRLQDVNGDGRADIIVTSFDASGTPSITTCYNTGTQFAQVPSFGTDTQWLSASLTGSTGQSLIEIQHAADGTAIATPWLASSSGYKQGTPSVIGQWNVGNRYLVGDINGDGNADVVVISQLGANAVATTWVNGANGFQQAGQTNLGAIPRDAKILIGDATGDGRADLWISYPGGPGATGISNNTNQVWVSNGSTFTAGMLGGAYGYTDDAQLVLANVAGNGAQTLVMVRHNNGAQGLQVEWSDASGNLTGGPWVALNQWYSMAPLVADVQGIGNKGLVELYLAGDNTTHAVAFAGHSDHSVSQIFDVSLNVPARNNSQFFAGQVAGTGRDDLVQVWENAQGQAVASIWTANAAGNGYTQGQDSVLGAWNPSANYQLLDANGDGRADIVMTSVDASGNPSITTWFSSGTQFVQTQNWSADTQWLPAKLSGEVGQSLIEIQHAADGTAVATQWLAAAAGGYTQGASTVIGQWVAGTHYLVSDLNNDGHDGLVVIADKGGRAVATTWAASAAGMQLSGTTDIGQWVATNRYLVGDCTGDGKADIWVVGYNGTSGVQGTSGTNGTLAVWTGNGKTFAQTATGVMYDLSWETEFTLADPNQSGKLQLQAVRRNGGNSERLYFNLPVNADGTISSNQPYTWLNNGSLTTLMTGDVLGTGNTGLIDIYQGSDGTMHANALPAGSNDLVSSLFDVSLGVPPRQNSQFLTGDVNGDGRTDLVQIWENAQGQAVASLWTVNAAGNGYTQGQDTVLDTWNPAASYQLIDANGDGRADIVISSTDASGNPSIGTWYSTGTQFTQTPVWSADTQWLTGDFYGKGKQDVLSIQHAADGTAVATVWNASQSGYVQGPSTVLGQWRADTQYLLGQSSAGTASGIVAIAHVGGNAVATRWTIGTNGLTHLDQSTLGAWGPNVRFSYGDVLGNGQLDLMTVAIPNASTLTVTRWAAGSTGFTQGASNTWPVYSMIMPPEVSFQDLHGTGRQLLVVDQDNNGDTTTRSCYEVDVNADGSLGLISSNGFAAGWHSIGTGNLLARLPVKHAGSPAGQDLGLVYDNGNGTASVQVFHGNGSAPTTQVLGAMQANQQFLTADVSGNGTSAIVQVWENAQGQAVASTWYANATGGGYTRGADSLLGAWVAGASYQLVDVNGDGRADLVATWADANGKTAIATWFSTGSQFVQSGDWSADFRSFAANLSGKGLRDQLTLAHTSDGQATLTQWYGAATGYTQGPVTTLGNWTAGDTYLVGDVLGDGTSQLVQIHYEGLGKALATIWTLGATGATQYATATFTGVDTISTYTLADLQGDGRACILASYDPQNGSTGYQAWLPQHHTITIAGLASSGDMTAFVDNVQLLNGGTVVAGSIADGGFENVPADGYTYNPTDPGAWTFNGNAGLTGNGSGFTGGAPNAPQGNQAAFLQGSGSISEAVNVTDGETLQFEATQRMNYGTSQQTLQVYEDGVAQGAPILPPSGSYATYDVALAKPGYFGLGTVYGVPGVQGAQRQTLTLDVNGDGLTDLVSIRDGGDGFDYAGVNLGAAGGTANGTSYKIGPAGGHYLVGNVADTAAQGLFEIYANADGTTHVQTVAPSAGGLTQGLDQSLGAPKLNQQFLAGDINGTHVTSLVQVWENGQGRAVATTWVWNATTQQFVAGPDQVLGAWQANTRYALQDIDGDGRVDLVASSVNAQGQVNVTTWLSNGTGFSQTGDWGGDTQTLYGNFGGSGQTDFVRVTHQADGTAQAQVWTATANGFVQGPTSTLDNWRADSTFLAGNVMGSGHSDLMEVRRLAGGRAQAIVWQWTPAGFVQGKTTDLLAEPAYGAVYRLADLTGSGKLDLVASYGDVTNGATGYAVWLPGGKHTVTIKGLQTTIWETAFVDNVQLLQNGAPVAGAITDAGFESVFADGYTYRPTDPGGWTFTSDAGLTGNNSGFTGGGPNAPEGNQAAFLQDTGTISQGVTLSDNETLQFQAVQRTNYVQGPQQLQVYVDGVAQGAVITPTSGAYGTYDVALNNPGYFALGTAYGVPGVQGAQRQLLTLDVNGDGLADLVSIRNGGDGFDYAGVNLGAAGGTANGVSYKVGPAGGYYLVGNLAAAKAQGLLEIYANADGTTHVQSVPSVNGALSQGTFDQSLGAPKASQQFLAADVNGDGATDLVQIWQNAQSQAVATVWTFNTATQKYVAGSDFVLGAWQASANFQLFGSSAGATLLGTWQNADRSWTTDSWTYANGAFTASATVASIAPSTFAATSATAAQSVSFSAGTAQQANAGVDLRVSNIAVTPAASGTIQSGGIVNIAWTTTNQGIQATLGNFQEQVVVINKATGAVVAKVSVPYVESAAGNGPIAKGQSVARSVSLRLPDGPLSAGMLEVSVETDADFSQNENQNALAHNIGVADFASTLAPYPDLQVGGLSLSPASNWQAGQTVTVSWNAANSGTGAAQGNWNERVQLVNTTTGAVVADLTQAFTSQNIAAGASAARTVSFTWPAGLNGVGQFQLTVTVDSTKQLVEYNAQGAIAGDNTGTQQLVVGPSIVAQNIAIAQTGLHDGQLVTLNWTDLNQGSVAVPGQYQDRVTIYHQNVDGSLGAIVSDTAVAFDDAGNPLAAGASRARSASFTLPVGATGAGNFVAVVAADSQASGAVSVFEVNASGQVVSTPVTTRLNFASTEQPYADLAPSGITAPATGMAGSNVTVTWTVSNKGQAAATGPWVDRVLLVGAGPNSSDLALGDHTVAGPLAAGQSYPASLNVQLPSRVSGSYAIAVVSDAGNVLAEPDTRSDSHAVGSSIVISQAYTDLVPTLGALPAQLNVNRTGSLSWTVTNTGTMPTDQSNWTDRVYLSTSPALDGSAILLGSTTHVGTVAVGASYTASLNNFTVPAGTVPGNYYVVVQTDAFGSLYALNHRADFTAASAATVSVAAEPKPDLGVGAITPSSTTWAPGQTVNVSYTVTNQGNDVANAWLTDSLSLVNTANPAQTIFLGSPAAQRNVAPNASYTGTFSFTVGAGGIAVPPGNWQLQVTADASHVLNEANVVSHIAAAPITMAAPAIGVDSLVTTGTLQGGQMVTLNWITHNSGTADAGAFTDAVYLTQNGVVDANAVKLGVVGHASLAAGQRVPSQLAFQLPIPASGNYQLVVVGNAGNTVDEAGQTAMHVATLPITVAMDSYEVLNVSNIQAPISPVIGDPANVTVSYTVTNSGTGAGSTSTWTDQVVYTTSDVLGSADDIVLGTYTHTGGLAVGASYTGSVSYTFPPGFSRHGHVFVRSNVGNTVWQNGQTAGNTLEASTPLDVMPEPYADIAVSAVAVNGTASSGQPLSVSWQVANRGIGVTDSTSWTDHVWLSSNPDGTGTTFDLGSYSHIGQLAAGGTYTGSLTATLPQGVQGTFYVNVKGAATGTPFEFTHTGDAQAVSAAVPITLSPAPALVVQTVTAPATATEGGAMDVSWTVGNSGNATAAGPWVDHIQMVPTSGGPAIDLGTFTYGQMLQQGQTYTRTQTVQIPTHLDGAYRIEVTTDSTGTVYESATAAAAGTLAAQNVTQVQLAPRPDLHVSAINVPTTAVTAGTQMSVSFTVDNTGAAEASGQWTDNVYLSL